MAFVCPTSFFGSKVQMSIVFMGFTPCGFSPEDGDSMFLRNVGMYLPAILRGIKTQKYNIVITNVMRTSNLTCIQMCSKFRRNISNRIKYLMN
jgi:hypothetical protein